MKKYIYKGQIITASSKEEAKVLAKKEFNSKETDRIKKLNSKLISELEKCKYIHYVDDNEKIVTFDTSKTPNYPMSFTIRTVLFGNKPRYDISVSCNDVKLILNNSIFWISHKNSIKEVVKYCDNVAKAYIEFMDKSLKLWKNLTSAIHNK